MITYRINRRIDAIYRRMGEPKDFYRGGIIDEKQYRKRSKVLFLLREGNQNPGMSLRKFASEVAKWPRSPKVGAKSWPTWKKIGLMAHGIEHGFPGLGRFGDESLDYMAREAIRGIAVLNATHGFGGVESEMLRLRRKFRCQAVYTLEIVKIINPDLVVCGNLRNLLSRKPFELHWHPLEVKRPVDGLRKDYFHATGHGVRWVDYYHPAARKSCRVLYEGLHKITAQLGW